MAELDMADYTGRILIEAPKNAWGIQTVKIKGAALKPGYPVTMTGETSPEVVTPATANDITFGILLCNPDHDIDTVYAAGDFVSCALVGSRAAVWTYAKASVADLFPGASIHNDAPSPGPYSIIAETSLFEWVGRVIEFSGTVANDRPIKVVLC